MGHDELTTHFTLERIIMGIQRTVYHLYGVRLADDTDWFPLEEDPGHCLNNNEVGLFRAGAYDQHKTYLAREWTRIEPGEWVFHSGIHAVAPKFERDRWNDDLLAVTDRLGLEVVEGPGWFTIPSEA
jgi:hypothetical protein